MRQMRSAPSVQRANSRSASSVRPSSAGRNRRKGDEQLLADPVLAGAGNRRVEAMEILALDVQVEQREPQVLVTRRRGERAFERLGNARDFANHRAQLRELHVSVDPVRMPGENGRQVALGLLAVSGGKSRCDEAGQNLAIVRRKPQRLLVKTLGRSAGFESGPRVAARDDRIGGRQRHGRAKRAQRVFVPVERAFEQCLPLQQACGRPRPNRRVKQRQRAFLLAAFERLACELLERLAVARSRRRIRERFIEAHNPSAPPSLAMRAATASRSTAVRSGCQTSKMKTTRRESLSFIASCSIVSSNTSASPGLQVRVSRPDPEPAAVGDDQRQVTDEPRVAHSDMSRDVGVGGEQGEHRVRAGARNRAAAAVARAAPSFADNAVHSLRPGRRS